MGKAKSSKDDSNPGAISVRVPGSTSNLGAGFDCFGLALQLYLTVEAELLSDGEAPFNVVIDGEGAEEIPRDVNNLIFRTMRFVAEREGVQLPPLNLVVHNEIPVGRGLGSSASAIVAGITLARSICKLRLSDQAVLQYASGLEGHADNVAAALFGGLTISCLKTDGEVLLARREWPHALKIVCVSPDKQLQTADARMVLEETVKRSAAVFNLQRAALFMWAIGSGDYDLLWEAMQDRLHQSQRELLVPGLKEALATAKRAGLLGVALSGSGPSVIALTLECSPEIGEEIAANFRNSGIGATVRLLEVDRDGCVVSDNL